MGDDSREDPVDIDIEALSKWLGEDAAPSLAQRRRTARTERWSSAFGSESAAALDLLAIADLAWHDCYGKIEMPTEVVDDLFDTSRGDIVQLIHMTNLAVIDWRDLRVSADKARSR